VSDVIPISLGQGDDVSALLDKLYEQGLYRQALNAAEAAWGPARNWQGNLQQLQGSRIISQLGLFRTSAALVLSAWRRERASATTSFNLKYTYLYTLFNLRGAYVARRAMRKLQDNLQADSEQQARWLGLSSFIHAAYRDWDVAYKCVDEAMTLSATPEKYHFERAWLYEMQDRYDEALKTLDTMAVRTLNLERMQVQSRSRLLEITGRRDEAVSILQDAFGRIESVDIGMRLHRLLVDDDKLDAAEACLTRMRALAPADAYGIGRGLAIAHADLLYQRGDFDGTLAALTPVNGYFYRKVKESLATSRHSGRRRELDIPFIRQHHMTCAPATITALWSYHGHSIDHFTLAEAICYDGTSDLAERRWMEQQGWAVREFELNLENITTLIDAGCPVGLATVEPGSAHMQAVIGYDTRKGIYLLRDPYYPAVQEMLINGAHEAYAASGPRCIVAVPPARREWLFALPLRHAELYDEYFQLQQALEANHRDEALACAKRLESASPGHRLSLWAQRSIARYDNDTLRQLQHTNTLLEKFPQDLNLLAAKSRMLGDLGKETERLQFLEDCRRSGIRHPYLLQALAEQMAQDSRRNAETLAVLDEILRRQPHSAAAWWTLAGVHWESLQKEEAFECYRLCLCLEDKVEGYATSYFKAARYLRRTDEALQHLKRRIDWLGLRSANPYITYARALDLLERTPEVLALLEEALQRHPKDTWLIDEAISFLCIAGEYARAETLLQEKSEILPEVTKLYKQARIMSARADMAAELACYRRILELQPRNERAAGNIARLLRESESVESALAFINAQLADNPHNLWLLHEKLSYANKLSLQERKPMLADMHALHPEDSRITMAWARLLRGEGQHDEALRLLQQAAAIEADAVNVQLELGDVYLEMARVEDARTAYSRAITLSVDADGAFEKLLSTHVSFEDKRKALQLIHSELMRQVSMGNGILEFQSLARRYLSDAEVRAFLDAAVETRPDLWQSWVALGSFLKETDQLEEAISVLDKAVAQFPLLPRLWLDRGEVRRLRGELEAAESDVRAAIAINPNYGLAVTTLADVLELGAHSEEALAVIEQGLRLDPLYVPYHNYRADLLWRMERRTDAFDALLNVFDFDPEHGWAWAKLQQWGKELERFAEVEKLTDSLLEKFPDSIFLWKQGAEIATHSERKHACLQRAIELAPHRSDLLLARCDLYAEEGRIDEARALIDAAYADRIKPTEILTQEAWMTEQTGRPVEAIAQLEALVQQDPAHYNAWRLLARWHDAAGNSADCCRCARQCVELFPQNANVLGMAADFLLRHFDKQNEAALKLEAREYLVRAINQDHTNTYNFLTLADLYLDEGDLDDCEQLFSRLLVDAKNPYIMTRRLRLALLRGKTQEAQEHYRYLLQHVDDNDWLVLQPLRWFIEHKQKAAAWACLQEIAQLESSPLMAARPWMYCVLADKTKGGKVFSELQLVAGRDDFWCEAVVYALGQGEASRSQLAPLFRKTKKKLQSDARLWTALVKYRAGQEAWGKLRALTKTAAIPEGVSARSVYSCSVAWRMSHNWSRARTFAAQAQGLVRDESHHNLLFWDQFDRALENWHDVDKELLAALDLRELSRVECMLLEVLHVVIDLPTAPTWRDVFSAHTLMWRLWYKHSELLWVPLVAHARSHLWWALLRQGQGGLLRRLVRATWYIWT